MRIQTMTDTNVTALRPDAASSRKPDPTNATRQRRHRAKREGVTPVAVTAPAVTSAALTTPTAMPDIPNGIKATVTALPTRPGVAVDGPPARNAADVLAYVVAVGLAGAAAWFSIRGMVVLFPGSPVSVVCMAVAMESAKLITAGWLASRWRATAWLWRLVLVTLIAGLAVINSAGVYAQLVAAHVGERGATQAALDSRIGDVDARIEVAAARVADLDHQIGQIDAAVAAATAKGKATTGLSAMEGQKKARAGIAGERQQAAASLAALKVERAQVTAKGRQVETEAAPIMYVAELVGASGDSQRAMRWLIALMVLCCDPLAIALTAAASAKR
jgi:hypothetical protein